MVIIKRIHFWYGLIGIFIFLLTGQYMHHYWSHLQDLADGPRMLFRSAHIYFLLASLLNLIMGVYLNPELIKRFKLIQYTMTSLLLLAPILILIGFFIESPTNDLSRPFTRIGIYCLLAVGLLALALNYKISKIEK